MGVNIKNKIKRQEQNLKIKKAKESAKRDERFRRKREEAKNPHLREQRLAENIPVTIDKKRVWDSVSGVDEGDALGLAVDVEQLVKRQKMEEEEAAKRAEEGESEDEEEDAEAEEDDDADSMLDEESSDNDSDEEDDKRKQKKQPAKRAPSPSATSTGTVSLTPEFLASKFPQLLNPPTETKILVTTSLNSTLHAHAKILCDLFPNANYIPRSSHRHGFKYSVQQIAQFASNRGYTALMVLMEDQKKPCGLDIVHLPKGPMFHFSISNWINGSAIPGHGNATNHHPELILNNFRTPLGLLTAHLFRSLFPQQPEFAGRQVVTMHNQRDYIFVRRHRYVFRDKRPTEKSVVDTDGKPIKDLDWLKTGLQAIGPNFTLKLRRVDRGIQRKSGQEWEWKGKMEKTRTRFQM